MYGSYGVQVHILGMHQHTLFKLDTKTPAQQNKSTLQSVCTHQESKHHGLSDLQFPHPLLCLLQIITYQVNENF